MTQQTTTTYRATLIDGTVVEGLSLEEANEYFYRYASSRIEPWPAQEYKAP